MDDKMVTAYPGGAAIPRRMIMELVAPNGHFTLLKLNICFLKDNLCIMDWLSHSHKLVYIFC